jgi:hypothetical protein
MMKTSLVKALLLWMTGAVAAQDAELTILVEGPLLEHGGVVDVLAVKRPGASVAPRIITLSDRYARIELPYPDGATYAYRFRPVNTETGRDGIDQFATEALTVSSRTVEGPDGPEEASMRSIRVLPFAEYGNASEAERTEVAWGVTQRHDAPPPANYWGARAMAYAFDTFGDRRTVGLLCQDQAGLRVCTPDPKDALLLEALWWRKIAEGRLERLRHDALAACYDSGGLLRRPARCDAVPGRGWPSYEPAE